MNKHVYILFTVLVQRIQYRVSARKKKQNGISSTISTRIFRYFEQYSTTRSNEVKSVEVVSGRARMQYFTNIEKFRRKIPLDF